MNLLDSITKFLESTGFAILGNEGGLAAFRTVVMLVIACVLVYLAIVKGFEPLLLLPIAIGMLLTNLPGGGMFHEEYFMTSGEIDYGEVLRHGGLLDLLYIGVKTGIYPCLIFIGIGAMIDFGPLLSNPKLMLFGAAAQFGIFFTFSLAALLGFPIKDAAAIGIIGAADGPTAIFMANFLKSNYLGAIMVAAYSYMALVPIVQPPVIRALTTKHERMIRMPYHQHTVSKRTKILFPIIITAVCGIVSPRSVALVGFLMFGNLIRVCGVLDSLSETAQKTLSNLITLFLGLTIAVRMQAAYFLTKQTLLIMALGLVAFMFDTAGGVLVAKLINLFLPKDKKLNPMIGACGISAFPMSARVVYKMAIKEDPQNYLLMQCVGVNVSGQVASVIAGGLLLNLLV